MQFFLIIQELWKNKKTFITVSNIDNNKHQINIRMTSEGSCNTEDWSNDAENTALPSQE